MAMIVKNNITAKETLNRLNKNSKALEKSLKKVSSGMQINGAADDASGYAISERMRVQIRGLEQDNRNTQNASSLMRVAEGAVSSTVKILKTLKEKALDAANDTNTDEDRRIIQKELEQSIDQVDDNAHVTFNGKYLVDGSHELPMSVQEMIVSALSTEWMENCLDLIEESYGVNFRDQRMAVKDISVQFTDSAGVGGGNVLAAVAYAAVPGQKAQELQLRINMDQFDAMDVHDTGNVNGENPAKTGVLDRTISHELTHAIMASGIADMGNLPLAVIEGMAELTHGIDDMRNLINADPTNNTRGTDGPYAGGYVGLRYMAKHGGDEQEALKRFMRVLVQKGAGAFDEAVNSATNGKFGSWTELTTQFAADQASSDAAHLEKYCGIILGNADTGAISGQDAHGSRMARTKDSIVPEGGSTKFWYAPGSKFTTINGLRIEWNSDYGSKAGDMTFQIGTKANQAIKVGFLNMTAEGLGLKSADGKKVSVATREQATNAIRLLDQSVSKAIYQQTTIGSILSRLEYTSANLTVASENVQNAESTLRDADMAKEMTEYTKNNVLLQAAQSMLAQANQNSSSVLSLLQ